MMISIPKETNLQTNYDQLHLEVPRMPMSFISMDFIDPFEVTSGGNQ